MLKFQILISEFEASCLKFRVLSSDDEVLSSDDEVLRLNSEPLRLDCGVKAIAQLALSRSSDRPRLDEEERSHRLQAII